MPIESAALTGGLFVAIDIIKTTFNLTGNTRAVRLIVFSLAQIFAFADAFGSLGATAKPSLYLVGSTALRGLLMAGTALGIHELRTPPSEPGSVAGVVGALGDATAAAGKAGAALDSVAADVQGVADIAADLKAGNRPGAIIAAPLIGSEIAAALPILTNIFGLKTADAVALATQNPAAVRSMVADAGTPPGAIALPANATRVIRLAPSVAIPSIDNAGDISSPPDVSAIPADVLANMPKSISTGKDNAPPAAPSSGLVGGDRNATIPE